MDMMSTNSKAREVDKFVLFENWLIQNGAEFSQVRKLGNTKIDNTFYSLRSLSPAIYYILNESLN